MVHAHLSDSCHSQQRGGCRAQPARQPSGGRTIDHLDSSTVLVGLIPAIVAVVGWGVWRHRGAWWIGLRVALAIYAAVIIGMTFFPFPLTPGPSLFIQPWILPIPLQTILLTIGRGWGSAEVRFLIGNVIGFIPLGVFYPLLRPATHTWRRAILVGLVVSLAIETTQVLLSLVVGYPYRQFDVDDLLLNTLGTALGYGAWRLVRRVRSAP